MAMTDLPFEQVRTLLAVVDEGTFDAAAKVLHVTPSAVSQRIKALEQSTGRVLLMRTKPARPTESGQTVVRYARQLAALEREVRAGLGVAEDGSPARLPIAVNADSLATWFLPALTRMPQQLPVCFELHCEDESYTATLLREGRVMAAVTSSAEPVAGCTARPLGLARYLPSARPEFVERHLSTGPLAECLPEAPVIVFDRRDELQDAFVRELTGGARGASSVRHHVPTSEGFCDAVVAGLGWGLLPEQQALSHFASGDLVGFAPERPFDVPLHWQQWKLDVPALALVAEAVATAAAQALHAPG
ncbi:MULTISPECIES: LysR family transcriptional regulator ArgP [Streptomyces]|nr:MULTISPECIES: LysR family transcriptional regulator ArgP [Streptomyces]QXQ23570.1 LysR family transcriptional regulator ArgP [Streptomyces albidoflavus]QXQ29496.1 LysR family transcriptional regulator ArgP [Streptomyces albidoflavus]RZD72686.1 LysR family transcriptional regulator ArgP [Streptomyces albidoflavus]RZD91730.1 transcriptional regulator LrhA [Streptomyces albidoflavus]BDH67000.1 transcriptional regulator ArgP [Streptomyces sp. PLM4]